MELNVEFHHVVLSFLLAQLDFRSLKMSLAFGGPVEKLSRKGVDIENLWKLVVERFEGKLNAVESVPFFLSDACWLW